MINPFTLMHQGFIAAFRQKGKRYLVLQTFSRENNLFKEEGKKYVLVSHYDRSAEAMHHYKVVKDDPVARTIDLENDGERSEFERMLNINSGYKVYSILDSNPEVTKRAIDKQLKYKIQDYIAANTQWRISRHHEFVPVLKTKFGELIVILKYNGHEIEVPLKELEKI